MSIERLYGKLKTHEMEQEQRQIIYAPGTVYIKNTTLLKTTTLVVRNVDETESRVEKPASDKQEVVEADYTESTHGSDEDDFYTMEELEQLETILWPTWQESSRTSGLEGTLNTSSKVDPTSVDPVAQGSEETEEGHLQVLSTSLDTRLVW